MPHLELDGSGQTVRLSQREDRATGECSVQQVKQRDSSCEMTTSVVVVVPARHLQDHTQEYIMGTRMNVLTFAASLMVAVFCSPLTHGNECWAKADTVATTPDSILGVKTI